MKTSLTGALGAAVLGFAVWTAGSPVVQADPESTDPMKSGKRARNPSRTAAVNPTPSGVRWTQSGPRAIGPDAGAAVLPGDRAGPAVAPPAGRHLRQSASAVRQMRHGARFSFSVRPASDKLGI